MTAPREQVAENFEDDVSADIIEQAYSTDSMKKFHGKSSTATATAARRRKKKATSREEADTTADAYDSDDAVRLDETQDDIDDDEDEDILEEIYATDSMKRLKKKTRGTSRTGDSSASSPRTRRAARTTGLNPINEDKSARDLVEGLRSFRIGKERIKDGSAKQNTYTSKVA